MLLADMLAFLDRGNIGNARLAGLQEDFQLSGNRYQWLINIFYIAYVLAEFGILLWKVFPPHIVGAVVVFGWYVKHTPRRCYFINTRSKISVWGGKGV